MKTKRTKCVAILLMIGIAVCMVSGPFATTRYRDVP